MIVKYKSTPWVLGLFLFFLFIKQAGAIVCVEGIDGVCDMRCQDVDYDCPSSEMIAHALHAENASAEENAVEEELLSNQKIPYFFLVIATFVFLSLLELFSFHHYHLIHHKKKEEAYLQQYIRQLLLRGYSISSIQQFLSAKYTKKEIERSFHVLQEEKQYSTQ